MIKDNSELNSEISEIMATVATSNNMNPKLKEQLLNALEVRSIKDDVEENTADIVYLKEFGAGLQEEVNTLDERFDSWVAALDNLYGTVHNLEGQVTSIDDRLSTAEKRTAVCGYRYGWALSSTTTLTFDRVYDEVNSGGTLEENGYFTATVPGIYLVTLKATVRLDDGEYLYGVLNLSSGNYNTNYEGRFITSYNDAGNRIDDQASASRYVKMAAGETLHISLEPYGTVEVYFATMCVSLYSASG